MLASESQIRTACLFYFLSLLDEERAKELAVSAVVQLKRKLVRGHVRPEASEKFFIESLLSQLKSEKNWRQGGQSVIFTPKDWGLPEGLALGPWLEFRRSSELNEFLSVLLVEILDFSELEVAQNLGVSPGTLRYRVGRGLKQLGTMCEAGGQT